MGVLGSGIGGFSSGFSRGYGIMADKRRQDTNDKRYLDLQRRQQSQDALSAGDRQYRTDRNTAADKLAAAALQADKDQLDITNKRRDTHLGLAVSQGERDSNAYAREKAQTDKESAKNETQRNIASLYNQTSGVVQMFNSSLAAFNNPDSTPENKAKSAETMKQINNSFSQFATSPQISAALAKKLRLGDGRVIAGAVYEPSINGFRFIIENANTGTTGFHTAKDGHPKADFVYLSMDSFRNMAGLKKEKVTETAADKANAKLYTIKDEYGATHLVNSRGEKINKDIANAEPTQEALIAAKNRLGKSSDWNPFNNPSENEILNEAIRYRSEGNSTQKKNGFDPSKIDALMNGGDQTKSKPESKRLVADGAAKARSKKIEEVRKPKESLRDMNRYIASKYPKSTSVRKVLDSLPKNKRIETFKALQIIDRISHSITGATSNADIKAIKKSLPDLPPDSKKIAQKLLGRATYVRVR